MTRCPSREVSFPAAVSRRPDASRTCTASPFLWETTHLMKTPRWTLRAVALVLGVVGGSLQLHAQGVTTGAIAGTVVDAAGAPVQGATIKVTNRSTGFTSAATTRANGYYLIPNLEVGGPYTVAIRRI